MDQVSVEVRQSDDDAVRTAAASVARATQDVGGTIAWTLDATLPISLDEQARAAVEGILLGSYRPGRWKTEERRERQIEKVVLCGGDAPELTDAAARAASVSR